MALCLAEEDDSLAVLRPNCSTETVTGLSREQRVCLCAFVSVFMNTLIRTDRVREHGCGGKA